MAPGLKLMNDQKDGIEWCNATLNPVVGCKNGCPYCYAKALSEERKLIKDFRDPKFFPERIQELDKTWDKAIFLDSMSDIQWWPEEVFEIIQGHLHRGNHYIMLTKMSFAELMEKLPSRFRDFWKNQRGKCQFVWIGCTAEDSDKCYQRNGIAFDFLSVEPLFGPFHLSLIAKYAKEVGIKAVICGAETGNYSGKRKLPDRDDGLRLIEDCAELRIPLFFKNSMRQTMGNEFKQEKLPWSTDHQKKDQKPEFIQMSLFGGGWF